MEQRYREQDTRRQIVRIMKREINFSVTIARTKFPFHMFKIQFRILADVFSECEHPAHLTLNNITFGLILRLCEIHRDLIDE